MRRLLPSILILSSCVASPPTAPVVAPPPPGLAATGVAQRVVVMTFDGLGADALAAQSGLIAFDHLARTGAKARVIPVNPTLTGPTHVSILTGADPQVHGIVSNWFHLPSTPRQQTARGLNTDIDVETLVESARRQGKRVGAVPFPTVDGTTSRRSADFGLVWTNPITQGRVIQLKRVDFKRDWVPPTWTRRPARRTSYSTIMRTRVEWAASKTLRTDVDVVAYDTTDDRVENYDTYTIESEDREIAPDSRGWFAIAKEHHGSWSKVLDAKTSLEVTLYWGAISRTQAYPDAFRDLLDSEAGFWPGAPDERSAIDSATLMDQIERLSDFLQRAQTLSIQRMPFDLLLAYQPVIDETLHNFLGQDENAIRRSYAAADRALAAMGSQLDVSRDALIVAGDHGLVPVEREIRIHRFLAEKGFAPRWQAFPANNVGHFYRFEGPDDSAALIEQLSRSGWFETIERKSATHHRSSGEIIATTFPPVGLSAGSTDPVESKPSQAGHHGALNSHRELHAVLLTAGFGTPRGDLGEVSQTRIARFVSALLGIDPPRSAE